MIVKKLPIVLLCLIKAREVTTSRFDLNAFIQKKMSEIAVLSASNLSSQVSQMTLESGSVEPSKPLLSPSEIFKRVEKVIRTISALDVKTAVEVLETELGQILESGGTLYNIASAIYFLPVDIERAVLSAIESKAYILLKILQKVYVWRDRQQYHWFMALSYKSPWYDKDMWGALKIFPLNWKKNLWAICKADNVALLTMLRREVQRSALESFDKKLLLLCIEHDSIKIFESVDFKPSQLKDHLEILARNGAAKLLQLYKAHTGIEHLYLEEYPFPGELPADVDGFEFLIANGYNFFSMENFIKMFCNKGRLDLLKYLQELNPKLVPGPKDLEYAAAKNFRDILDWARQFDIRRYFSGYSFCEILLANRHFNTLCWWIDVNNITINQRMLKMIAEYGALEVLQRVDNKELGKCGLQEVADSAVKNGHYPVLEWLYEKFNILPGVRCLMYASGEMLDWMKYKGGALESPLLALRLEGISLKYEDLIEYGPGNFELLRWIFNKQFSSAFDTKREIIAKNMQSKGMMLWLHDKLKICPPEISGAYKAGDLETIKWAVENCGIYITEKNIISAAKKGHLHIIKWIHENVYPKNPSCLGIDTLNAAISKGNFKIAEYLRFHVFSEEKTKVSMFIKHGIRAENHLATLKWAHEHGFDIDQQTLQMSVAACNEDIETLEWLSDNLLTSEPDSGLRWGTLTGCNLHKSYGWLLEKFPGVRHSFDLDYDVTSAYESGSLGILKVIHGKYPLLLSSLLEKPVTKKNYHAHQWLIANGYPLKDLN